VACLDTYSSAFFAVAVGTIPEPFRDVTIVFTASFVIIPFASRSEEGVGTLGNNPCVIPLPNDCPNSLSVNAVFVGQEKDILPILYILFPNKIILLLTKYPCNFK
jgi:hypothetical protein